MVAEPGGNGVRIHFDFGTFLGSHLVVRYKSTVNMKQIVGLSFYKAACDLIPRLFSLRRCIRSLRKDNRSSSIGWVAAIIINK